MSKQDKTTTVPITSENKSPTRVERRRLATRASLLAAAYKVMSAKGIDAATLQEITDEADVGFGTIYNYFSSKNELAANVLDCVIDDLGKRNDIATADFKENDPALVMPISMRLVIREAIQDPMWHWWVLRSDLLVERMRAGFKRFAIRDMKIAAEHDVYSIAGNDFEAAWAVAVWMIVGCMRDVVTGNCQYEHKNQVVESILRVVGVPAEGCKTMSTHPLPDYPESSIDFSFSLVSDK